MPFTPYLTPQQNLSWPQVLSTRCSRTSFKHLNFSTGFAVRALHHANLDQKDEHLSGSQETYSDSKNAEVPSAGGVQETDLNIVQSSVKGMSRSVMTDGSE